MEAVVPLVINVAGAVASAIIQSQVSRKSVPSPPLTKEKLKEIFMKFDTDNDNNLSFTEIKNAFACLGALFPAYRAAYGLWLADDNNDGRVDLKELDDLIKYACKLGYTIS